MILFLTNEFQLQHGARLGLESAGNVDGVHESPDNTIPTRFGSQRGAVRVAILLFAYCAGARVRS